MTWEIFVPENQLFVGFYGKTWLEKVLKIFQGAKTSTQSVIAGIFRYFGYFLPSNFRIYCFDDMKLPEMVFIVEIHSSVKMIITA